jgi:transposase
MKKPAESAEKTGRRKRTKYPAHACVTRTFKFAMDVPEAMSARFFGACDTLCDKVRNRLVDHLSEQRKANRKIKADGGKPTWPTKGALEKLVARWAKEDESLKGLHSHLLQNVVDRVLEGTKRWLEALKEGRTNVRPPTRKDARKYRSFTYKQYGNGCRIENHRVFLSGFGWTKLHDYRKLVGRPTTLTVKFTQGRWWCVVTCQVFEKDWYGETDIESDDRPDLGADPGLSSLLTTSDGRVFDPPKALKERLHALKKAQRVVARKFRVREALHAAAVAAKTEKRPLREVPYSNRLKAAIGDVARLHTKVERVREHHHKKLASRLADTVRRLAVEEHGVQFMIRNRRQARSASDRAIASMKHHLASAFGAERHVPTPNRRDGIGGNSQTCVCGAAVPKDLSERTHRCPACGLVAPRDMVSANIVQMIAFDSVSEELAALMREANINVEIPNAGKRPETAGSRRETNPPVGGQPAERRGGDEGGAGESPSAERATASESPVKCQPPRFPFVDGAPRVGNLPRKARPGANGRLLAEPDSGALSRKPSCHRQRCEGSPGL